MVMRTVRLLAALVLVSGLALKVMAEPLIYGQWIQGGHVMGQVEPGSTVQWNDQAVAINPFGQFFIGLGRDADRKYLLKVISPEGVAWQQTLSIKRRDYRIQRINGVPQNTVDIPEDQLERIGQEVQQVKTARANNLRLEGFMQPFVWPVFGPITGVYGSQRVYNGEPRRPHYGVDIARAEGTPVYAPADGLVTMAEPDLYFSGGTVIIDHGYQLTSTLMHLSAVSVEPGELVRQGDLIGRVGSTGRSTGPHLDWRMNWRNARIDPVMLVTPMDDVCVPKNPDSEKGVVILLHGLGRSDRSMSGMANYLMQNGYGVCNQGYPSTTSAVELLSSYVGNALERVERAGAKKVHLVTHSMGGILARYYLQRRTLPNGSRVVMLSPPNQGSEVIDNLSNWRWFGRLMGPAALQLSTSANSLPNRMPGTLAETGIITGTSSSDPWFNWMFAGDTDGKVSVESARMNGMTDFLTVNRGHTRIMAADEVQYQTRYFLDNGFFDHRLAKQ
jgi:murein DD-endopeptidase MepM/ murein hydrolase activator NlpD